MLTIEEAQQTILNRITLLETKKSLVRWFEPGYPCGLICLTPESVRTLGAPVKVSLMDRSSELLEGAP